VIRVLTQNLRHYMLHMLHVLRSPTESCAVEVGRSRLQNGDVAYGSNSEVESHSRRVRFTPMNGRRQTEPIGPFRAMMYGPGRALQDRSSKTDERESCNNVSGL
jgi:hypothetical protein